MKKRVVLCILIVFCFIFQLMICNASTDTKERTIDNYLVPNNIKVTDDNKDNILETPAIDETEKIYDFANLLTDEEEQDLYSKVKDYINNYKLDLAIVTINQNDKLDVEEYADDFYDYNNFGIGKTRDGVLFLIDMDTRQIHMTTTGNGIIMYDDNRIDTVLDEVYSYMSDNQFHTGISNYIEKISSYANDGIPESNKNAYLDEFGNVKVKKVMPWTVLLLISLGVTILVIGIMIFKNKLVRKATTAEEYLKRETVKINNDGVLFLGSNTVKHKIETSSGSSGGGSSTHFGSSGSSHGGGSHGF